MFYGVFAILTFIMRLCWTHDQHHDKFNLVKTISIILACTGMMLVISNSCKNHNSSNDSELAPSYITGDDWMIKHIKYAQDHPGISTKDNPYSFKSHNIKYNSNSMQVLKISKIEQED